MTVLLLPRHSVLGPIYVHYGWWILSCLELIMGESSHARSLQHITFDIALVLLLVSVCCDTAQAKTGTGEIEKWWLVDTVFQTPR